MNWNTKIIVIVIILLTVTTAIGAFFNMRYSEERRTSLEAAEISVIVDGSEAKRFNMESLAELGSEEFSAKLKSSIMESPEEHTYTGIALKELFTSAGISLEDRSRVITYSADGYAVPLKIKEIQENDNIYLVFKDNGDYLRLYGEKDGQGPYMIVVRGDRYSQRWAKYVVELVVE